MRVNLCLFNDLPFSYTMIVNFLALDFTANINGICVIVAKTSEALVLVKNCSVLDVRNKMVNRGIIFGKIGNGTDYSFMRVGDKIRSEATKLPKLLLPGFSC